MRSLPPTLERAGLAASVDQALDAVVARLDAREMLIAIVFDQEVDRAPVTRPHRRHDVAVERARQDARRAAIGGDDCEVMSRVIDELRIARGHERELASVGTPARRRHRRGVAAVALERREQPRRRARLRGHDVQTELVVAIRIGAALAEERDLLAVGRPRGPAFVEALPASGFPLCGSRRRIHINAGAGCRGSRSCPL